MEMLTIEILNPKAKWLLGTHNFTLETIAFIEKHLNITLITVTEEVFGV